MPEGGGFTWHDKKLQIFLYTFFIEHFLCFNLHFTNDLPIFLERQTCKCHCCEEGAERTE